MQSFVLLLSNGTAADGGGGGGGAGMEMMDDVARSCTPQRFVVPMFAAVGANGTMVSSYHSASDAAHTILGVLLLGMVLSWAAFVMEAIRLRAASRLSGICQLAMGTYLFSWLFLFMHPQDVRALWAYSTTDMLQLQHCAIAALLCAGGIIELLQAACLLPPMSAGGGRAGGYWHVLWSANLIVTGMVFMLHPQHTYAATIKHLLLGSSLILGAPLFIHAKALAWKAEMAASAAEAAAANTTAGYGENTSRIQRRAYHVEWSMVVAGGSFALAACILLAFRETETVGPHIGTTRHCQPALLVVVMAYSLSATSSLAACIVAGRQYFLNQRKRRGAAASGGSIGSPAATDPATDAGGCVEFVRRRWEAVRARRFRLLWSEEDEQQEMVGLESQSQCPRGGANGGVLRGPHSHLRVSPALSTPTSLHLDGSDADDQMELSVSPVAPASGSRFSNGHRVHAPAAVTISPLHSLPATVEDEEADYEEEQWREMQRERRRHEEYTGDDDLADV